MLAVQTLIYDPPVGVDLATGPFWRFRSESMACKVFYRDFASTYYNTMRIFFRLLYADKIHTQHLLCWQSTSTAKVVAGQSLLMVLTLTKNAQEQGQEELFGVSSTVRSIVQASGPKKAVEAGRIAALVPRPSSVSKALAGRMGRQIADVASASLIREVEGGAEPGYSYSAWCLAGLPHRDLPEGKEWLIDTGFARLLIRPGIRLRDDNSFEHIGVPFGAYARLLLIDWQTEALARGSREIVMGRSASAVVNRLGVNRGGTSNAKIVQQLERLATCSMDFTFGNDKRGAVVNQRLVEGFEYASVSSRWETRNLLPVCHGLAA